MSNHNCKAYPRGCGRFREHAHWTGLATCHCSKCGRLFSNETAFNLHYTMDQSTGEMTCYDPVSLLRKKDRQPALKAIDKPRFEPNIVWTRNDPREGRHGGNLDGEEDVA